MRDNRGRILWCGLNQRHFLAVNFFDQLEIKRLQSLAGAHVEAGHQDFINGLIELIARLFALVVFEIQFALFEVRVGAFDDLIDAHIGLLDFSRNFARGRAAGNLGLNACGNQECCDNQNGACS